MNQKELAKVKKQATQVAEIKGQDINDLIGAFLQDYIQTNLADVLDDYVKLKESKNQNSDAKPTSHVNPNPFSYPKEDLED